MPQDFKQAAAWYRKAAEQGDAIAQLQLGRMYFAGQGVPQDFKQAYVWTREAAEQRVAKAQFILGVMYGQGRGVPQDDQKAYAWVSVAAVNGVGQAAEVRDSVARELTPAALAEAQTLADVYIVLYSPQS